MVRLIVRPLLLALCRFHPEFESCVRCGNSVRIGVHLGTEVSCGAQEELALNRLPQSEATRPISYTALRLKLDFLVLAKESLALTERLAASKAGFSPVFS